MSRKNRPDERSYQWEHIPADVFDEARRRCDEDHLTMKWLLVELLSQWIEDRQKLDASRAAR